MSQSNSKGLGQQPDSKIEQAKKLLDSKYAKVRERPRAKMHEHHINASEEWSHGQPSSSPVATLSRAAKSSGSLFKKIFIISALFFAIAAIFAGMSLFGGRNVVSTDSIDLEVLAKAFADGGETLDVTIQITNKNSAALELADLVVEYPRSSVEGGETERERRSLGTIRSGQTVIEDFQVVLFGEEGEERPISASLEYRVQGSNAIFVKESETLVALQSTPVQVTIDAPDTLVSNQIVTFDVNVISNATAVTEDMLLSVEYPAGFSFEEADPAPSLGNSFWNIGDLPPGEEKTIAITGSLRAQAGEERIFRAYIGEQDPRNERRILTAFNSDVHSVLVQNSFLGATVKIDNKDGDTVAIDSSDTVRVSVAWENTLAERLSDVEVTAKLSGSAYDRATIVPDRGFFDSNSNTVLWNDSTGSPLGSVEPGDRGVLTFDMRSRPLVSGTSVIDKPEIYVDVNVRGIDGAGNVRSAENITQKTAAINSDFQVTQRTLFYGGLFSNTGPYPPRAEQPTTMTLVWTVTNTSNTIENGKITTTLPASVQWAGRTSPSSENITYNSVKREITWDLGTVQKSTGFQLDPREVAFQVEILPSTSQVGGAPPLTSDVILSGDDMFTGSLLRMIRRAHVTRLLNDVQSNAGLVLP